MDGALVRGDWPFADSSEYIAALAAYGAHFRALLTNRS
jgi:hypothetical protein